MALNKINYQIVGRFNYGSKYGVISSQEVIGYQIDQYAAVRKHEDWKSCQWTVDSIETGIAITTTGSATRKDAITKYEEMKSQVIRILEDTKKLEAMLKQKQDARPETELAQYEELDVVTLHDHRMDKLQQAAKRRGCIIKAVTEETYQHGGHFKVYGTTEMLQEVRTMIENYAAMDAERTNETAKAEEEKTIDVSTLNADNLAEYLPALLMSLENDKHNSSIILAAGIEAGAIKPEALLEYFQTGRMPAVHTFDVWKKAGYSVRKGEKHAFEARIWKYTEKKTGTYTEEEAAAINAMVINADGSKIEAGDEKISRDFIKKTAYFFTSAQVEKTPEPAALPDLPADVKKETKGSCTWISGNTRPIKEELKAAGFRWSKKNGAWYRREAA